MKKKIYLLPMIFFVNIVFSQIGIGTANPRGALDINKDTINNMGLVLPVNADPKNLINPMGGNVALGTMMYDSTMDCVKVYKSTGWSNCLSDQGNPTSNFSLDCSSGALSGTFTEGVVGGGTKKINYTNAAGQSYAALSIASTGVTGLTATAPGGTLVNGNGNITLSISGIPSSAGTANFAINIAGQTCVFEVPVNGVTPVFTLDCSTGTLTGVFTESIPGSGTKMINYTGGSGQMYGTVSVASTGVTGLTATAPAGTLVGNGNIILSISGTPSSAGTASFVINIGGQSCMFSVNVNSGIGTFDSPAVSCQSIFDQYNSSGILVANDGEYWIGTPTSKFKTKCDMVDAAEAAALNKEVGGYTLLWSYSEGRAKTDNAYGVNGRISWGSTALDNRNVVTTQSGTMDYNNFRITTAEKRRWVNKVTRLSFTDEPTNANKDLATYLNYPASSIVNGGTDFRNVGSGTITGKYLGGVARLSKNPTGDRGTLTIDNIMIRNNIYFYNGAYNFHWDITDYRYAPTLNGGNGAIISNWPLWVVNEWTSEMPFGKCVSGLSSFTTLAPQGGGFSNKTFTNACLPNNSTIDRHPGVNGTEGYVLQWWAK